MTNISASAVFSLRSRTGVSILLCKKALEEAQGNEEKAIEILRKSGEAQAVKRAGKDQREGNVFLAQSADRAALVLLQCETDFVARNEDFQAFGQKFADLLLAEGENAVRTRAEKDLPVIVQKLGENISLGEVLILEAPVLGTYVHTNRKIGVIVGLDKGETSVAKDVAMHAAAMNPLYRTPQDVPPEAIEREKEIWKSQLVKEGKPEAIWDKIMLGKEKKFREENALTTQEFVKDPTKTVAQYLNGASVQAYVRLAVG
ncbi:translation elongation factor Ts [Candidatus Peregrinibacteria bacterium CG10_big_fil_rev_8_21_14_0_10_55_24]|nr:MAG: translation elongation factor Ts [Candidatus Peregrinibacteria bacterium CG10_big_fil_rev_8_21_14_0_10_55_24]